MTLDLQALYDAVARYGKVARVVVARVDGSAPREAGASMLVWKGGQSGTIGGGALELEAATLARSGAFCRHFPLGPSMGQCCGGAVTLVCEVFDAATLPKGPIFARRIRGDEAMPFKIKRDMAANRNSGNPVKFRFEHGWLLEAVTQPNREIWIYGAGHVGRAIAAVLVPMPELNITLIDTSATRFPAGMDGITELVSAHPADAVAHAPDKAEHLVLTFSHAFDLDICHRILARPFAGAGLIGSKTKWARFRKRLRALGHANSQIDRITCPIGDPALGKHPQAIAISVASQILSPAGQGELTMEMRA